MNLFVISDTHFGHENILTFKRGDGLPLRLHGDPPRPFSCVEEMDELMVDLWNRDVRSQDHVYHLGDVAMRKQALRVLKRLNGRLRLVLGNHDTLPIQVYLAYFEKVFGYRVMDNVLFSHIPVSDRSLARFTGNVHGHVHTNGNLPMPYLNVCVDVTGFRPVPIEEVRVRLRDGRPFLAPAAPVCAA